MREFRPSIGRVMLGFDVIFWKDLISIARLIGGSGVWGRSPHLNINICHAFLAWFFACGGLGEKKNGLNALLFFPPERWVSKNHDRKARGVWGFFPI